MSLADMYTNAGMLTDVAGVQMTLICRSFTASPVTRSPIIKVPNEGGIAGSDLALPTNGASCG